MTWELDTSPNLTSLPHYHGLRTYCNSKLLLFVTKLVPKFNQSKHKFEDLRIRLQEAGQTYLAEEYPELAGTAEELHEILTTILDAEHRTTVSKSTDNHIYDSVIDNLSLIHISEPTRPY